MIELTDGLFIIKIRCIPKSSQQEMGIHFLAVMDSKTFKYIYPYPGVTFKYFLYPSFPFLHRK